MSRAILEGVDLCKIYSNGQKEVRAVDGVTISLAEGSILIVAGPSGAGKSTLLHLLGGLDRPTSGKVLVGNTDIYQLTDKRRARMRNERIGFVFQFYHLLPEFTALENVLLPALMSNQKSVAGYRKIRDRAKGLLETVGLGSRIDHKPAGLSGGEAQRVAIARALMNEPDILLCDEPTGNLDSEMGEEIVRLLVDLNKKRGVSLIIVTHQDNLIEEADKVLHIRDGRLI